MADAMDTIYVLHVDDERDFANLAATFLEREDDRFDVETATSASEGLAQLETSTYDCVVSDHDMPGKNGIEFLEEVREEYPDLPFILYTGKGGEEVASDAISAGVTEYLQKEGGTSQYTVLANRIRNAVEKYDAQTELADREKRLELFFEQSPLGVIEWDENFNFVRLNDAAERILGYSEDTLAGRSWNVIVPESNQMPVDDIVSELLKNSGGYRSVNENIREDGERIICEWHNRVVTDDSGDVVAIFSQFQDITEKEERKAELQQSERRYEAVFNDPNILVGLLDTDGTVLDINQTAMGYIEPTLEEITGKPFWETPWFEHAEGVQQEVRAWTDRAADGEYVEFDIDLVRPNGEPYTLEGVFRPVTNDDGDVVSLLISDRDITEQRERQQELEEMNALLSTLIETLPVGVLAEDESRNVLAVNERLFELFELPVDSGAVIGADCEQIAEEVSDMFVEPEQFVEGVDELIGKNTPTTDEELVLSDGRTFERSYRPIDLTDGDGHLWLYRDVTDRVEREREREITVEFLQSLYDVATDKGLDVDEKIMRLLELGPEKLDLPRGYLTRIEVSDATTETGTQRVIEASGDHELLQPGGSCPLSESYCRKTIRTDRVVSIPDALAAGWAGDPAYELFDLGCYIGTTLTVGDELYGTVFFAARAPREEPFTSAEQTFVRLMGQLVSYELERDHAREELEQQNERLAEFTSIVSHDLRNPLTVAGGRLELAREEGDNEHLESVARAHERMNVLIDDLLTLAREGTEATDLEPVSLAECSEVCWQTVETADATLVIDSHRTLTADRSQLQQLLENLYRNAVEHGGADATVTVGELDSGFYVEDDGPGIPENERDEVFNAGYSTRDDGTGFGLSIVRQVVDAHGWQIRLTEGAEGGARFEITGVEFTAE